MLTEFGNRLCLLAAFLGDDCAGESVTGMSKLALSAGTDSVSVG